MPRSPTAALLSAGATTPAAAADEQRAAAQFICGFHELSGTAYYGHCDAPPRTDIVIKVTYGPLGGTGSYNLCVKPGVTTLGPALVIWNAVYTGSRCSAG
ncbi:DUF6355 family natural product biosynthesis protein [Actinomadura sp. 6N118]|uniref:DUF6355 family natural product biosynthesis protein n=1 Tax=Actinomadura sp. 6N118 TaxID=3375151 RepID=UPI003787FC9C